MSRLTRRPSGMIVVLLFLVVPWLVACGGSAKEQVQYNCPMHPTYVADRPGDCPICGMDLVPMESAPPPAGHEGMGDTSGAGSSEGPATGVEGYSTVHVGSEGINLAGIRTTAATRGRITRTVRAVGIVAADETRAHRVHARVSGWVEKLFVNFTGQSVREGEPLLALYSPELAASQEEYLRARDAAARFAGSTLPEVRQGAEDLVAGARERLLAFDVPPRLLASIEATREPQRTVTLDAPVGGYVTGKDVFEGTRIDPGMALFTIADLSRVWVEAEVYEQEASLVRLGLEATVTLPYDPDYEASGAVSFIGPTLNPGTRTLRVRVDLPNPALALRPGMYANVDLAVESAEGVLIPDDAILDSGIRRVVFVQGDAGTYEPREVSLGLRSGGRAQVLSGVAEGERVVIRANFLLDSESRLKSAIGGASGAHPHDAGSPPGESEADRPAPAPTGHVHGGGR